MRTHFQLYVTLFLLVGCSSLSSNYPDLPKQIATAQASLAAAEHSALVYVSLPPCGKTTSPLCRQPDITAKIGAADNAAYKALTAADQAQSQDAVNAAITAINTLTSITLTLPK